MPGLVLGTRGSRLALWQARHVAGCLHACHPDLALEERIIKTEGDIQQERPIGPGDQGVFVRRIEQALLSGEIDLAVHSMKDLPTTQPAGLIIAAIPPRHDPRDVLLTLQGWKIDELPAGSAIGTSSFRRRTQLLHYRPDLTTEPVRGNVDTRLRKVAAGRLDALVLALAGVQRLGLDDVPGQPIDTSICLPATGQGALAIETREDDAATRACVAVLNDEPTAIAVTAERAFLRTLGGGCLAPATGFAEVRGDRVEIRAAVGDPDGVELLRDSEQGATRQARALGERLAARMLENGAGELLARARRQASLGDDGVPRE